MATLATSFRAIGPDAPGLRMDREDNASGLAGSAYLTFQLQHARSAFGEDTFSYRQADRSATPAANVVDAAIQSLAWSLYQLRYQFTTCLDIPINRRDTLVEVETVGDDLSWSLTEDAVTTLENHSDLYGELLYWNGSSWLKREDFDKPSCRRIRFRAKLNEDAAKAAHKFSYHVLLRNEEGQLVEYEIDPDIKNPSV